MYEDYWQLRSKPFEPPGGGAAFFASEAHRGSMLKLRYAIEQRRPAAALAGPAGVGKTLLVDRVIGELATELGPVARVVFPQMRGADLLAYLAQRLEAPADPAGRYTVDESLGRLERLFRSLAEQQRQALLVIDEAHLLEDEGLLETVRLLLNVAAVAGGVNAPAATLLLVGQMGLLSSLGRNRGLEERVAVKSLLRAFSVDEAADYLRHRLTAAGANRAIFTDQAIEMMHALTGGVARRIDRLGDLALVVGFADGLKEIGPTHIESVSQELLGAAPE